MGGIIARIHQNWQRLARNRRVTLILLGLSIIIVVVLTIYLQITRGYIFPYWTGIGDYRDSDGKFYRGKTLWDLLEILIIPVFLAIGVYWLNQQARKIDHERGERRAEIDREIVIDGQRETNLQNYLDAIDELILEKGLIESTPEDVIRDVARSRTLTTLRMLDPIRKGLIIRFLYESDLISEVPEPIINLNSANLISTDLQYAYLKGVNLESADLMNVNLYSAFLQEANFYFSDLRESNLQEADLTNADLVSTNLKEADLTAAKLTSANLGKANLISANLEGASIDNERVFFGADLHPISRSSAVVGRVPAGWEG